MNLPETYLNNMKELLGAEGFAAYCDALQKPACHGVRLNRLKGERAELLALLQKEGLDQRCAFSEIPWSEAGFSVSDSRALSLHPYYAAGLYYIQEPSAMTPAEMLPVSPGERVLDLCAAPGGKATRLAEKLAGSGFLLANDISASRARALVKNLETAGASAYCVTAEAPEKLAGVYSAYFDKILLDAPCSGEGMFRREPKGAADWQKKGPAWYREIQAQLLRCAAGMLRAGGLLLYSTCTFSEAENEEVILSFLEERSDFSSVRLPSFSGFERGRKGLSDAVRLYPHLLNGEGHFVCLLEKTGKSGEANDDAGRSFPEEPKSSLPAGARDFLDTLGADFQSGSFFTEGERLYYLRAAVERKKTLRYLRTGLLLGSMKKERFSPSRALALALKKEEAHLVLDLPAGDPTVQKYLRGESFPAPEELTRGNDWVLFLADGHPLGWLKASGGMLKNKKSDA